MTDSEQWREFTTGGADPDDESDDDPPEQNPWDFGRLVSKDGDVIPPGACEGYHNGENQRELVGDE
jgi:hypothetical protein